MICQALTRALFPVLTAGLLTTCTIAPELDHREISPDLKAALAANARKPTSQEIAANKIHYQAAITHDGPVVTPMVIREGMPLVPASLNGKGHLPFLVDTGSQGCVLEARTAVKHHVKVLDADSATMTLGGTTGNEPALFGFPDEFAVGTWKFRNFPFFVRTRETHIRQGILERRNLGFDLMGMNAILESCDYLTISFPLKRVVFGLDGAYPEPSGPGVWQAPLIIRDGLPYVELQTNGRTWLALVDSGFNGLLDVDRDTAERLGILREAKPSDAVRFGLGAPQRGSASQFGTVVLPKLDSLGPKMVNIPVLIVPERTKIGTALLRPFTVTLDFRRRMLWLIDPRHGS